jgi:hypothetical protein
MNNMGASINIFAEKGFAISGEHYRTDQFPGSIIYYFEVTQKSPGV